MIIRDSELNTYEEITARINSIDRQREMLMSQETRPSVILFEKKCAKITKLTNRYEALWAKRAKLIRSQKA